MTGQHVFRLAFEYGVDDPNPAPFSLEDEPFPTFEAAYEAGEKRWQEDYHEYGGDPGWGFVVVRCKS